MTQQTSDEHAWYHCEVPDTSEGKIEHLRAELQAFEKEHDLTRSFLHDAKQDLLAQKANHLQSDRATKRAPIAAIETCTEAKSKQPTKHSCNFCKREGHTVRHCWNLWGGNPPAHFRQLAYPQSRTNYSVRFWSFFFLGFHHFLYPFATAISVTFVNVLSLMCTDC